MHHAFAGTFGARITNMGQFKILMELIDAGLKESLKASVRRYAQVTANGSFGLLDEKKIIFCPMSMHLIDRSF